MKKLRRMKKPKRIRPLSERHKFRKWFKKLLGIKSPTPYPDGYKGILLTIDELHEWRARDDE